MKKLVLLSSVLFAACGDDTNPMKQDAGVDIDAEIIVDAAIDAPSFVGPTPIKVPISTGGPDQIFSAAPGPSGTFYVAGYTAATPAGAKMVFVARLTAAGALDTTFNTTGIFTSTLTFVGGLDEIDVAVQSDGKVVVAATIADLDVAGDRDVGLFRVSSAGALDATFGIVGTTPGYSRIELSTAWNDGGMLKGLDSLRSLAVGPSDNLFIHAATRDEAENGGMSADTQFTVARLTSLGLLDTIGYGTGGFTSVELDETNSEAVPRQLAVLSDGSVIASGYARTNASGGKVQPVLYKLDAAGARVNGWAGGVYHETVLTEQTEIYGFAIDGDRITTAGYGRESGANNVWTPMRFNLTDGTRSTTFGGATAGVPLIDPSGGTAGNNCRAGVGLSGGKTALVGSTGGSGSRNGALAIITQNGQLDTTYGTGILTFDLGSDDQWWGVAVNAGNLLVGGWKGYASQMDTTNDDSYVAILPLQ